MPERLQTSISPNSWGPFHPDLPGPMRIDLRMDGERVVSAQTQTGFLHKGLEKTMERRTWFAATAMADRVDSESSIFSELALCMAVEELCSIQVPRRAQSIRIILSELNRIAVHLGYLARLAKICGFDTNAHYILRERELILDLFELMTGSRFNLNFLRFGGVSADITEGFIERVFETGRLIQMRLEEYHAMMIDNEVFVGRFAWLGVITAEEALFYGLTGPNARASGLGFDVRKEFPYSGYHLLDFQIAMGGGRRGTRGDGFDRIQIRLDEIQTSLSLLNHVAEGVPSGDYQSMRVSPDFTVPAGEAYGRVESARGFLGVHIVSDGGIHPVRVQWRVPSLSHLSVIPKLARGSTLQELPLILGTLDISLAESDR